MEEKNLNDIIQKVVFSEEPTSFLYFQDEIILKIIEKISVYFEIISRNFENPDGLPSNVKNILVKLSNFVFNLIKTINSSKLPPHRDLIVHDKTDKEIHQTFRFISWR